jgi:hypothetical protein
VISTLPPRLETPCAIRVVQYQSRLVASVQPSTRSARSDWRRTGSRLIRMTASSAALVANAAASSRNTQPAPAVKISRPAMAGPKSHAALRMVPISELACWRAGPSTVPATSDIVVGMAHPDAIPLIACAMQISTRCTEPNTSRIATTAWLIARTRSAMMETVRGSSRSASVPPSGNRSSFGIRAQASTVASAAAEPVARTMAMARAAGTTASPIIARDLPTKSSRNSRSRRRLSTSTTVV